MNGNEVYEQKYIEKISNLINKNKDIYVLRGFSNSLSDKSYSTIYSYVCNVVKFVKSVNKDIVDIRYDDYINYLSEIKGKTSAYQITIYASLKKFSEYLVAADYSFKDYMKSVNMPKAREGIITKQKREVGFLTEEEIIVYINNIKNGNGSDHAMFFREKELERNLALVLILLNTGMRCSALWKLNVDNIDFNNNMLITVDKEESLEEHYLSQDTMDAINDWMIVRNKILNGENEDALFITSRNKKRMSKETIAQIVNKYAFNIDGKHITPHKLRATYGTHLYNKTHDLYMVQQCMGHASPQTTEKYIRGKQDSGRKMACDIMNNIINNN